MYITCLGSGYEILLAVTISALKFNFAVEQGVVFGSQGDH